MAWTIFAPETISKPLETITCSDPLTSEFNHYSSSLTQYREANREPKSRLAVEKYQLYVEIATDVLQTRNQAQLKALKNFLNTLPSPTDIEAVLTEAVNQLAEIDLEAYRWVLKYPDYLMPEIDLVNIAQNLVVSILKTQGFMLGQDFHLTSDGQIKMSKAAEMALFMNSSETEYFFIQEMFIDGLSSDDSDKVNH